MRVAVPAGVREPPLILRVMTSGRSMRAAAVLSALSPGPRVAVVVVVVAHGVRPRRHQAPDLAILALFAPARLVPVGDRAGACLRQQGVPLRCRHSAQARSRSTMAPTARGTWCTVARY